MLIGVQGYFFQGCFFLEFINDSLLDIIISKPGEEIVLNNVQFSNNSYELNEMSKNELDKLSNYLIKYNINIQIEGHTDSNGDSTLNLILSENRAKSVYDYLIIKGVQQDQLFYIGFGDSKPLVDNNSEKGRALNRRTSFKSG